MILPHDDFPATPAPEPEPAPTPLFELPVGTVISGVRLGRRLEYEQDSSICYEALHLGSGTVMEVQELFPWAVVKRSPELNVVPEEFSRLSVWTQIRDDFERDGRALARLTHPSIQRVVDVVDAHGTVFLIKEPLTGETLGARLSRERLLPEPVLRTMLLPLLDGLEAVHALGITHRAMCRASIHLDESGGGKLGGFLAPNRSHVGDPQADTDKTRVIRRPLFLFNEDLRPYESYEHSLEDTRQVGPKADLYALAAMTVEAMTGERVMEATTRMYHACWLAKLTDLCKERYSHRFCEVIEKAFAILAQERVGSAREFREMLGE